MEIKTRIRESFDRQGMMSTLGARLVAVAPGAVEIEAAITPEVSQQHGFAHAALAFALGDSAAGYAAISALTTAADLPWMAATCRGRFLCCPTRRGDGEREALRE